MGYIIVKITDLHDILELMPVEAGKGVDIFVGL